jgi:hypothetical protein
VTHGWSPREHVEGRPRPVRLFPNVVTLGGHRISGRLRSLYPNSPPEALLVFDAALESGNQEDCGIYGRWRVRLNSLRGAEIIEDPLQEQQLFWLDNTTLFLRETSQHSACTPAAPGPFLNHTTLLKMFVRNFRDRISGSHVAASAADTRMWAESPRQTSHYRVGAHSYARRAVRFGERYRYDDECTKRAPKRK